jgi:uncharacterized glyoxalase superfamily protein PhnB
MDTSHIPKGFHTVTPYLVTNDAEKVLDFVQKGLNAEVTDKMLQKDGSVMHAQFRVGDSMVMVGPGGDQTWPGMLYLYVEDADKLYAQAIKAGAESVCEPKDEFYGDRVAAVKDPGGNQWWIATQKEKLSHEELQDRVQTAGY